MWKSTEGKQTKNGGGVGRQDRVLHRAHPRLNCFGLADRAGIDLIVDEAGRESEGTQRPNVRVRWLCGEKEVNPCSSNRVAGGTDSFCRAWSRLGWNRHGWAGGTEGIGASAGPQSNVLETADVRSLQTSAVPILESSQAPKGGRGEGCFGPDIVICHLNLGVCATPEQAPKRRTCGNKRGSQNGCGHAAGTETGLNSSERSDT